MTYLKSQREITFDIFKGIAIILMVSAHTKCPGAHFVYLFHMAIFFICSGIFFKDKYIENIGNLFNHIKSKIKHLYVPYVLWNGFLTILHNYLIKINIYTNNPSFLLLPLGANFGIREFYSLPQVIKKFLYTFLFYHGEQLGGATWFLKVLFFISVITAIGYYLGKILIKNKLILYLIRPICFILALFVGYGLKKIGFQFYGIGIMFSCAILYYIGILYGKFKDKININFYAFISGLFILLFLNKCGNVGLAANNYPNPLFLLAASISGFVFILYISKLISKFNYPAAILSYIGKHTLSILLFHFAAFKIVTAIYIIVFSKPSYYLAAFPTLISENFWWFFYTIAGVFIPISVSFIWEVLKSKYSLNIQKSNQN